MRIILQYPEGLEEKDCLTSIHEGLLKFEGRRLSTWKSRLTSKN